MSQLLPLKGTAPTGSMQIKDLTPYYQQEVGYVSVYQNINSLCP